jgi:SAM-dependent methyltransferase
LSQLLAVAERDPLSKHLQTYLPADGTILEGGCGLGQYVVYFRAQGYRIVGGDFSFGALRAHRQERATTPLAVMDLSKLPFAGDLFAAHISLGVVEHLERGPQPIVREMARTLRPGGIALVSVPWLNGLRQFLRPALLRRERQKQAAGMSFYQYLYSRREIRRFLAGAGLRVLRFYPYSPAKGLREFLPKRRSPLAPPKEPGSSSPREPRGRRILYWPPLLYMTAHMILAVAVKEPAA